MAVRLFVGNLSYNTTDAELRTYFATVAQPSQVVLPVDRETGRPRGFAFVEMASETDAQAAIDQLHEKPFAGRTLTVNEARPQEARSGGFGGGGRNNGDRGGSSRRRSEPRW